MDQPRTRIQIKNRTAILDAALEVFSRQGFRGATLDQIAAEAGLSKPNLLYYFPSKEAIHVTLLSRLMETWLDPLRELDAQEIVQGAPRMGDALASDLKALVDDKARVIGIWAGAGRIASLDPHHLIFSIWALTQHYADFDVQVRAVLGPGRDPLAEAERQLDLHFRRVLTP